MNNRCYRLVFSTLRGILTAVAETAIGHGNSSRGETGLSVALQSFTLLHWAGFWSVRCSSYE
ncbi:ESPR domain-containing protein [Paraburkholderia sp. BR14374]|uniref:ESPR domain-containing protein n=1 Tax=Paraburkholderia sp. BR14374 TaxID=3237007 RepID=UPI0034CF4BD1